jgi:uncharacterized membrane protein
VVEIATGVASDVMSPPSAPPQSSAFDEDRFTELLRQHNSGSREAFLVLLLGVTSFVLGVALLVTAFIGY